MAEQTRTPHTRTASYLAEPGEVHRVLLLYSGGLDTSVMLKWIQDEYEAEVVALTINLGQPGEDYDVVRGKAEQLGAVAAGEVGGDAGGVGRGDAVDFGGGIARLVVHVAAEVREG